MKLIEIKEVVAEDYELKEGVIPVHITMTLGQILRDGKITNPVQYFVMGAMVEMFKTGNVTRWPRDLNAYSMTTDAFLIDSLKQLTEPEQVGMAAWLLTELQKPVKFETNPYVCTNPNMNPVDWVRWVLSRQS